MTPEKFESLCKVKAVFDKYLDLLISTLEKSLEEDEQ